MDVSRTLSSYQKIDDIVQLILTTGAELTNSQDCSLFLYDEETDSLRLVAASWFAREPDKRDILEDIHVPIGDSIAGWVYEHARPKISLHAERDPMMFRPLSEMLDTRVRSLAAVPLIFKGKAMGVVEIFNKYAGAFNNQDIAILATLASQAAMVIYNAHLLEKSEAAYEELAELDRMKSDFVAIVSHELRTPLGLILGHATMLQELADEAHQEQISVIVRNALRLKDIVEDLSAVNNMQTGQSRLRQNQVSLQNVIESAILKFGRMAREKQISLQSRLEQDHLFVQADEDKLNLILQNLLKNALTFTNRGGNVVVRAERFKDHIKISVQDDGIGIPQKDLHRIFDRFYQVESHLRRHHGGLGLGLAVARDMVELHGGRIWVESLEGRGSTFSFLIPVGAAEPALQIPLLTLHR